MTPEMPQQMARQVPQRTVRQISRTPSAGVLLRRGLGRAAALRLSGWLPALVLAGTAVAVASAASGASSSSDGERAWDVLASLRTALEVDSPQRASFRQTFVPADFDEGESEEGTLAIALPRCMRWDYTGDFAKSYLLCDDWAHTWNPGEPKGRRARVDDELALEAPGLDFFLLGLEQLRRRYQVRSLDVAAPGLTIELVPRQPTPEVASLRVVLDPQGRRVLVLEYLDEEGSRTTFELDGYTPGVEPGTFAPPAGIEWEDS
ncbi:MAG: outer membrane lipoprotein carrier protein LolA [Acidobacteria bacterium]|nr:MAG: outer membrane lipoprotein carrier protein LolA [Acidobacteriota bacterium]REK00521.1 MAG: outer membrane lipoprotein carrier protein LolA [Acidobacteriota bacterium]